MSCLSPPHLFTLSREKPMQNIGEVDKVLFALSPLFWYLLTTANLGTNAKLCPNSQHQLT